MKKIDISAKKYPNTFTLVDDHVYDWVSRWNWHIHTCKDKKYVSRTSYGKHILLHRYIADAPPNMDVDHKDGNGLNNQISNLRLCSTSQNLMNRGKQRNNTSGYKGVSRRKHRPLWRAGIYVNGKTKHLGDYFCLIKAAKAYDEAAKKYHGDFARLNFPV